MKAAPSFESGFDSQNLFWSCPTSPEHLCCRIESHTKSLWGCFQGSYYGNSHSFSHLSSAEIFAKDLPFSIYSYKKAAIGSCADPTIIQIPAKHLQGWICQRSQMKAFLFPLYFLCQPGISYFPTTYLLWFFVCEKSLDSREVYSY